MNPIPITYGEFYDVPRMIQLRFGGQWYFLRSHFDEGNDEYNDYYDVYLLPFRSEDEFKANPNYWTELEKASHLGRVPIREVGLDQTRRRSIDGDAMEKWLSAQKKESGV
jgi:hypothetical protein